MQVVGHQNIGVNGDIELLRGLAKPTEKDGVIASISKNQLPIIAALNDVMRLMGYDKAWEASHICLIYDENQASLAN